MAIYAIEPCMTIEEVRANTAGRVWERVQDAYQKAKAATDPEQKKRYVEEYRQLLEEYNSYCFETTTEKK